MSEGNRNEPNQDQNPQRRPDRKEQEQTKNPQDQNRGREERREEE
jgi:hypothetical protein